MGIPGTANVISFEDHPVTLTGLSITIEFEELAEKIQMSGNNPAILKAAEAVFKKNRGIWQPAAVYQWFAFNTGNTKGIGTILRSGPGEADSVDICTGHSGRFLTEASHVLTAVYTAGSKIDDAAAEASRTNDFLGAHFLDLLGLLVLEKTEARVKQLAEEKAVSAGWGVSPFLSPGSVHGWNLEEQVKLAGLLPVKNIHVDISETAVFSPFKTISCLIGIGPGYTRTEVGSTCQVCSKRKDCPMHRNHS
ncbi:MAG: hypothetical protein MI863_16930 [Desulfobacterales bacterium]|nr:hypothetical protein [Desulfobacterales bacterium]